MYVWRSKLLANYAPGYIITVAPNLVTARRNAEIMVKAYMLGQKEYLFLDDEDFEADLAKGLADIAVEPNTCGTILIRGSE